MENAIMLHNLAPKDLEQLIKKIVEDALCNLPIDKPDELLTREQACSLLKINKTSLWKWTKQGKIIAYVISNRVLYKKSELMESLVRIN
ncbi:helix-turn-helix domain-containing protein [Flavobacterium ovatum]|uniref:helix-turn-helix domain-containing protein n=1 Tax=Flavobacterium ovatum TaxID=1928857 RepID=UPI00344EC1A7